MSWIMPLGHEFLNCYYTPLQSSEDGSCNLLKVDGEPGRTRTYNPLIKSQLLYH